MAKEEGLGLGWIVLGFIALAIGIAIPVAIAYWIGRSWHNRNQEVITINDGVLTI